MVNDSSFSCDFMCVNHTMQVSLFNHSSDFDVGEWVSEVKCVGVHVS